MKPNSSEEALFQAAMGLGPADRSALLDRECAGAPALRARLEALLAAHDQPDTLACRSHHSLPSAVATDPAPYPPHDTIGLNLGRYRLLERLGEGGCGVVYVAEQDQPVRRRVALKLIKPGMDSKVVLARFDAERHALARMDHPNIARVLDAGTSDTGRPFFVMELVRGIRITDFCDQQKLSTRDRLELFIKVCHAIQHAHQKGIIHRDIKPSNILVTLHDGVPVPKVIDFGIAKAIEGRLTDATLYTQWHQFLGTPAYMSPEQAEMSGLDIDTRSDIYSLGVLLYELLTGETPFDGRELLASGLDQMRRTIRETEPLRPSTRLTQVRANRRLSTALVTLPSSPLPSDLDWIVMRCLEKDRNRRYETANGLAADLKRHLCHEPVLARPPSATYRLQKAWRRNRLMFAATAMLILGLLTAVASLGIVVQRSRTTLETARSLAAERVRLAILSCDTDEAEQLLKLAEAGGVSESKLHFLHALNLVAEAQPEKAHAHLDAVRTMEPGNLTARAMHAIATFASSGWSAYEPMIPALFQAEPATPEERLFVGYAISHAHHQRAISLMSQAIEEESSPLARVLLASVNSRKAVDSQDLNLMQRALEDLSAASAWKPRAVRVLTSGVEIHLAAARLFQHAGDTRRHQEQLELASQSVHQLEQLHPRSLIASEARLKFFIDQGRFDEALDLALHSSRVHKDHQLAKVTARLLGLHGRYREAMNLAQAFPSDPLMRAVYFLAAIELPDGLDDARTSVADLSRETPADLNAVFVGAFMNLMLGDTNQSVRLAQAFLENRGLVARLSMPATALRVVRFLAAETSEEELLNAATHGHGRSLAHHFVGVRHLARGDRAAAITHLRQSIDGIPTQSTARHLSKHLLDRMAAAPDWPPTIPRSSPVATSNSPP